jgi:hypothetical protein
VTRMRRWRNITALFTTGVLMVAAGLDYFWWRQDDWWIKHVNKTSVAIENRTDESVEIVSLSVSGVRRHVNRPLAAGEFTLLLGFFAETTPSQRPEFELLFKRGQHDTTQVFYHRAAKQHIARECDYKLVIGPEGVGVTRSGDTGTGSARACPF